MARKRAECPQCINAPEGQKHCHGECDKVKSLEEFHNDNSSKDGKSNNCKVCNNKKSKEYAESRRAENPRWNYEYQKKWDEEHFERYAVYDNTKRVRNAASVQHWNATWNAENKERKYEHAALRRARKKDAPVSEVVTRSKVVERDDWTCMAEICYHPDGRAIDSSLTYINPETGRPDPWYLNIDHIQDLHFDGDHTYANVRASHARCNQKRKKGKRRKDQS